MFPKRLKLPIGEFPKRSTLCFRGKSLSVKKIHNKCGHPRFGVIISTQTSPKATVRNQIKRIIYNFLGEHLEEIPQDTDLLVVVEGRIIEVDSNIEEVLYGDLEKGLKTLIS